MSPKCRFALSVVGVAFLLGALGLEIEKSPPEPVYQNKPLRYWLSAYAPTVPKDAATPSREDADEAMWQLGTNAVPTLLRWLQLPGETLMDRLFDLARRQPYIAITHRAAYPNLTAEAGFRALGPAASNAVPQLLLLMKEKRTPFLQQSIPVLLGQMGPPAKQAVPLLLRGLASPHGMVRNNCAYALGEINSDPEVVIPALIKCLSDPADFVRARAASALGKYGRRAQPALPELIRAWQGETSNTNSASVTDFETATGQTWLDNFGPRYGIVPSPLSGRAYGIQEAIQKIDPNAIDHATAANEPRSP